VLKRIDDTADTARCKGTAGYSHYQHTQAAQQFVLCLKLLN
jgi:hypothetical protein